MAISRTDLLKRIRSGRRVVYDQPAPDRSEMIEPSARPTRLFRLVKPLTPRSGMPQSQPAQPKPVGLTPTQDILINQIPQKYKKPRHEIRAWLVNYLAQRDPASLVKHLEMHFDYPAPKGLSFETPVPGPKAVQEHSKKIFGYISGLEQHLHRQGNKNYGHEIMKSMGDYLDQTLPVDKVRMEMERDFGKS